MPLNICNSRPGTVCEEAKAKIASDITRIHCAVTDAPPTFVHAFFFEDGPQPPLGDKRAIIYGQIRAGRTDAQKADIREPMGVALAEHTGLGAEDLLVHTTDTLASWVMASWVIEGGDVLPEPGEEEAWLAKHEAKLAPLKEAAQ